MLGRIAVHLARRGLQDLALHPLRQAEHVDGAVDAGLGRLHGIELVVDRRGRAGEIVDLVDLHEEGKRHVVAHRLEVVVVQEMNDVFPAAAEIVVDAEDVVAVPQQPFAEMGAEEAGPACHQNPSSQLRLLKMRRCQIPDQAPATAEVMGRTGNPLGNAGLYGDGP